MTQINHPRILGVGTALPRHYATQAQITEKLRSLWKTSDLPDARLERLHKKISVQGRYLALPLENYWRFNSFQEFNDAWIQNSLELSQKAIERVLDAQETDVGEIDHLFFVSSTGIAVPSIDARLMNRLGFRTDMKRTPIFGLGCAGGAAGLSRAADYLRAYPNEKALVLSVELCSLTFQKKDLSAANAIATGLFGDAAAVALLSGSARASLENEGGSPQIRAVGSVFYPHTEEIMGWKIVDHGFQLILSPQVPKISEKYMKKNLQDFLGPQELELSSIRHWVCHTGGPKVLRTLEEALNLPADALALTWASLEKFGNLSSASIFFVLEEKLKRAQAEPGEVGIYLAMGPGFCAELGLLQW